MEIVIVIRLFFLGAALRTFRRLLAELGGLALPLPGRPAAILLFWLLHVELVVTLEVRKGLRGYTALFQKVPERYFVVKRQRAVVAVSSLAVKALVRVLSLNFLIIRGLVLLFLRLVRLHLTALVILLFRRLFHLLFVWDLGC